MDRITMRYAQPQERSALEGVQWRASLANPDDREMLLANPDVIELPAAQIEARQVVVADLDGACAGFAVILPRDDGDVELDGLFVEPELWKAGVGRALVDHCSGLAAGMGASALHVVGNTHALGFYHRCGFVTVGPYATRFGPARSLRRAL